MALNNSASNTKSTILLKIPLLEQKSNKKNVKRIIKRLSYAAILLPFIFAIWEIINFRIKELPQQNTHRLLQVVPELF